MHRSKIPVRELFERCAAGDEPAWQEFLARFGLAVRRAVVLVLGRRTCPTEIEDFLQEIYCALLAREGHRLRVFRGQSEAEASRFLSRTAERLVRDVARAQGRRGRAGWGPWTVTYLVANHTVVDPRPGPEARFLGGERRRLVVDGCRAVMPGAIAARLVELAVFEGWGSRELARASRGRLTPGNVDTLLSRARQRLAPIGLLLPHRTSLQPSTARGDA